MQKTDVTFELVDELQIKTKEYLQPNPTARAKMAAVKGISKLSGQAKASTYPQSEGVLGECMVMYGKKMGEDTIFGEYTTQILVYHYLTEVSYCSVGFKLAMFTEVRALNTPTKSQMFCYSCKWKQ